MHISKSLIINSDFFKEYTEKIANELLTKVSKTNIKDVKGDGDFEVVATTETIDRHGEIIMMKAWDFTNFKKNPVVLLSHDYQSMPIGAVTDIIAEEDKKRIIVKGVFANTEDGQTARRLYDDGMLNTMSVGFIAKERDENIITKAELLEVSFVAIPANPDALALSKIAKFANKFLTADLLEESQEKAIPQTETALQKLDKLVDDLIAIKLHYSLPIEEIEAKQGRVLSEKNRLLLQSAVEALEAVLGMNEEPQEDVGKALQDLLKDTQGMQKMLEGVIKKAKTVKNNL